MQMAFFDSARLYFVSMKLSMQMVIVVPESYIISTVPGMQEF